MKLLWLDLETTGLDPKSCVIIEVGAAIADLERPTEIEVVANDIVALPIGRANFVFETGAIQLHAKTGLMDLVSQSQTTVREVEEKLLRVVPAVESKDDLTVLAGSSVHFDHQFIKRHMPWLNERLSHRHLDVSSLKLACRAMGHPKFEKRECHRAIADVVESIEQFQDCIRYLSGAVELKRAA